MIVAAVVTAGVSGVGEPCAAEGAGDEISDGGVGVRLVPGAGLLLVFAPFPGPLRARIACLRTSSALPHVDDI